MGKEIELRCEEDDYGKYGYIDKKGNWVINPKFEDAREFDEGIARVKLNGKWGFIKPDGNFLIEPKFDYANDPIEGITRVKLNGKYGFLKSDGTYLAEPKFDFVLDPINGITRVELDGKYGFLKSDGTYLVEPKFEDAGEFNEGITRVKLNGKYGFLKSDGTYLVEPKFEDAGKFNEGIARVKHNGKWGFLKMDGTYLIEPKFDVATSFRYGEALVMDNGLYKILLPDGSFMKMSKIEEYKLSCREIQNWGPGGWSFLEASWKDGKWQFDSWSRIMDDNYEWYDARYDDLEEEEEVVRYYDEVCHNKEFADWANSLNLSTSEEVGTLLWANAQQLIDDAQIPQESGGYGAPLRNLTLLIQLYNQLENIKNLDLLNLRNNLDLPQEDDLYLNPDKVKKEGVKLCAQEVADEDGYEYLDFSELLQYSREPGNYNFISDYDFNFVESEEEEDWDEEEDDE